MKLTSSEIRSFSGCRRKWYLTYVNELQRIKPEHTGPLALGNRVHGALEDLYTKGEEKAIDNMLMSYRQDSEAYPDEAEKLGKESELALAMVEGYIDWLGETGADQELTVIDVEVELEASYDGVDLLCKLDQLVVDEDDGIWFVDHKTVMDFSVTSRLQQDTQMLHYGLMVRMLYGDRYRGGIYNMLRKVKRTGRAKPPFYWREIIRHSDEELEAHWTRLRYIVDEMERVRELGFEAAYTAPSRENCSICPFNRICSSFDDGSDVDFILETGFERVDPLERYAVVQSGFTTAREDGLE